MYDLSAVAYSSTASRPLNGRDLDELLIEARSFNEKLQVTGALLHHEGAFFQYFEGPPQSVAKVYERIRKSSQHQDIVELLNQPIGARQFSSWHMGFTEAPRNVLEELSNDFWEMTLPSLYQQQTQSQGLELLLIFWDTARHGSASP